MTLSFAFRLVVEDASSYYQHHEFHDGGSHTHLKIENDLAFSASLAGLEDPRIPGPLGVRNSDWI